MSAGELQKAWTKFWRDADWLRTVPRCPLTQKARGTNTRKKESSRTRLSVTVCVTDPITTRRQKSKGPLRCRRQTLAITNYCRCCYCITVLLQSSLGAAVRLRQLLQPRSLLSFLDDNISWNDDHSVSQERKTHKMFCLRRYVGISSPRLSRSKANL
jgi:hypothetical protein